MRRCAVDRLACVSLPAFPLQLLLRRHPEWIAHPAAVVDADRPQGRILWVSEKARQAGVLPGLSYAEALSLAAGLRAGAVPATEVEAEIGALTERLRRFTPDIEPSSEEPGIFWLNVAGLDRLYASLNAWARSVSVEIGSVGFRAAVVVGFTRFGTYAVAKAREGIAVFDDPSRERAAAQQVPLDRLNLERDFRDMLLQLGVRTVGALLTLPGEGLFERFGPAAYRLHRLASGGLPAPLQPHPVRESIRQTLTLEDPETDIPRLSFLIKRLIHPLLAALVVRGEALAALTLRLRLEEKGWREECVRPAAPTLDAVQLLDLVRLRLEALELPAGVVEIDLAAQGFPATREQLGAFTEQPRRDLAAADRALARIRAEFGDGAVVRARLADGHQPEASFTWEPLARVALPGPRSVAVRTLVRRALATPVVWEREVASRLQGPYVVSGGWWSEEADRDYYFAETRRGDRLWVYYDRQRRQWFLHGRIE